MFYVYVLRSKADDKLYIGYTNNLRRRVTEHNTGKNKSTKYRRPFELVYYEAYKASDDAEKREERSQRFGRVYEGLKRRLPERRKNWSVLGK